MSLEGLFQHIIKYRSIQAYFDFVEAFKLFKSAIIAAESDSDGWQDAWLDDISPLADQLDVLRAFISELEHSGLRWAAEQVINNFMIGGQAHQHALALAAMADSVNQLIASEDTEHYGDKVDYLVSLIDILNISEELKEALTLIMSKLFSYDVSKTKERQAELRKQHDFH